MHNCSKIVSQIHKASKENKRVVFVSGNFNVIHPGHLRILNFAAECGDFLVVGNTPGVAVAEHPMNILMGAAIGKALEEYNSDNEGVIEILVGRL